MEYQEQYEPERAGMIIGYIKGAYYPRMNTNGKATASRLAADASKALGFRVTPGAMMSALYECGYSPTGTTPDNQGGADIAFPLAIKRENNAKYRRWIGLR